MDEEILQFFEYQHLSLPLQQVSEPFGSLATMIVRMLPHNAERSICLRKLLEAKDAAVRARVAR
jgi:hypothetical protein